jgi:recombination protein RecT
VTCAQLGLEPNTPQGHIYLIPFENKRKGTTEVQVIVGYKGLIDLARRSGEIVSISSHAVRSHDRFDVDFGTEESIVHKPKLDGDRGEIIGFYAVAKLQGGGTQFEYMTLGEVERIRDGSQGYSTAKRFAKDMGVINSPWATNFEEMGRKTAIRRLCKYLPMSVELAGAVALDGRADRGESQGLDGVLDGEFSVIETGGETPEDVATEDAPPRPTRSEFNEAANPPQVEGATSVQGDARANELLGA